MRERINWNLGASDLNTCGEPSGKMQSDTFMEKLLMQIAKVEITA
jgi:hypothetical protein